MVDLDWLGFKASFQALEHIGTNMTALCTLAVLHACHIASGFTINWLAILDDMDDDNSNNSKYTRFPLYWAVCLLELATKNDPRISS